jgi:hypothetical protein
MLLTEIRAYCPPESLGPSFEAKLLDKAVAEGEFDVLTQPAVKELAAKQIRAIRIRSRISQARVRCHAEHEHFDPAAVAAGELSPEE